MREYIIRKCPKCGREITLVMLDVKMLNDIVYEGYCSDCNIYVKRRIYKCRNCDRYTLHEPLGVMGDFMLWKCEECGAIKRVYIGLRRSPQRSMM